MEERVVFVINKLNPSAAASLIKLRQELAGDIHVVVVRDVRVAPQNRSHIELDDMMVSEIETDFFKEDQLKADLEPFRGKLLGVVSRGESSIQYLARLSAICRELGVSLPSSESLEVATDKQRMRQRFMDNAPEVTPAFMRVMDASQSTMQVVSDTVGYPLVVKPANLASSLLIQKCDTPEQAERAISDALMTIKRLYDESGRYEEPVVIVEQMLEGELYSVDAYIAGDGEIFYCPAVEYVTGQSIGVDDFFLYRRTAPTGLEPEAWNSCKQAIERGIRAIGLTATTAHVELCNTRAGWKIIEIGPRVGRYRIEMYRETYEIEHSDNDIKIRLGLKPTISETPKAFCSVYSIYPSAEGTLERIDNFDAIRTLPSLVYIRRLVDDGVEVRHAKHGGHALGEVILAHADKSQFEQDCKWFEDSVKAVVR